MCLLATPAVSVVHAIDVDCPVAKAFDFMQDVQQWLPWAMPQAQVLLPLHLGQQLVKTAHGLAKLQLRGNQALGTLEYELVAATKSSSSCWSRANPAAGYDGVFIWLR
ncbi:hypothetical protein A0257_06645 [Hymenobacter psoromatis]|nr:hypothetical protein A0257_06645 [Hymenobacter psoromatis]